MQSIDSLPPPDTPWVLSKNVLDEAGLLGDLHLLGPGAEKLHDAPAPGARLLFVASGPVTVVNGRTNHILQAEETLRLPAGAGFALRNSGPRPAKVLVIDLPPPPPARSPVELAALHA